MTTSLRGLQGWVTRESPRAPLLLRCAESATTRDRSAPEAVAVRLTGCAAKLVHHELVELVVLGVPSVTVDLDGCSAPAAAHAQLVPLIDRLGALGVASVRLTGGPTAAAAAAATQVPDDGGPAEEIDAGHLPRTRRQALLLDELPALPDESLPAHVRLRDAVLAVAAAEGVALDADSPAVVLAAPGCDTCGVCVRSCPLDALSITELPAGGELAITTLVHRPAWCDGCRRCIDLCPPQVLAADGHHPWQLVQDDEGAAVHTLTTRRCARCSARMPATTPGTRCAPCEQRHRNPFSATWPSSAVRPR